MLRYYVQVSPLILPAVDDRPLVMKRFPNGVTKQAFYQQRHPEQTPPGVRRAWPGHSRSSGSATLTALPGADYATVPRLR